MFRYISFLCLVSITFGDLRIGSRPREYYYLRQERGSVKWTTNFTLLHHRYMEPSTFGYKGLEHQKKRNYDNFLRSNIDNEQDNRNFDDEDGKDHLPFRTYENEVYDEYQLYPGSRNGYVQGPLQIGVAKVLKPGESVLVPLRWNNPHASEMEVNIWIFDHAGDQPVVVPIRKPSCSGEGYQDNVISFTVPEDFSSLGSKIPGFKGCNEDAEPMCTLQVYSHSVESRTYAIGFPIIIPGHKESLETSSSEGIQSASTDPWLDVSSLRDLCLPATDPSGTISSAVPRWARLVSDVYNHAYQNSDYSPYSGQQHESISKNLQASAINKMETGNRGELGKSILTSEASKRLSNLRKLEDRIYKNYESLANKIIKSIGAKMETTGSIGVQPLAKCFRCSEAGSTNAKRLQTNTYIPSFQLPKELEVAAKKLVPEKYAGLFSKTGQVQIYVAAMSDLLPFFYESRHLGIIYQEGVLKTTMSTMADATHFKKRNEEGDTDKGVYAASKAKHAFVASRGCPGECLYAKPQLPSGAQCDETLSGSKDAGYRGCQNTTTSGRTCQAWSSQSPHRHSRTPEQRPGNGLVFNYCRNPDGEKTIWCYTTDPGKRWEYCDQIPQPTTTRTTTPPTCDETIPAIGYIGYRGCQRKTRSGRTCQQWSSQSPHRHSRTPQRYPGRALESNYCRGPSNKYLWCYTTDPKDRWDYCDPIQPAVPQQTTTTTTTPSACDEALSGSKGAGYRGCQSKTRSGRSCQLWSAQFPHKHSRTTSRYPGRGLVSNYCRNPDGEKTIWCYTTDPKKRWEYCDNKAADSSSDAAESWFCVARASKKNVKGPYPDIQAAKQELNKLPGSSDNKQMICQMSKGGATMDPHKVGGENQGGGTEAGFNKYWSNWNDIYHMNELCTTNDMCRFNGNLPQADKSSWFCVANINKKSVSGPYPDVASAKAELNKLSGSSSNRQMICEMTQRGPKADPHVVGGQNQRGNGFNKYWNNWNDIYYMNEMCATNDMCRFNGTLPQADKSSWFCVANANKKNVSGPYPDIGSAKAELNKLSGSSSNRQMICEMTQGGAEADPHKVGGQNQGAGQVNGFNKYWSNWNDIKKMNGLCEASLSCQFNVEKNNVLKPILKGSFATNVTGPCASCVQFFGKKVHVVEKPDVTPLAQNVLSSGHEPSKISKSDRIPENPDDFGLSSDSRRRRRATSLIQKQKRKGKKSKRRHQARRLKMVHDFMTRVDLNGPGALILEALNDVSPLPNRGK